MDSIEVRRERDGTFRYRFKVGNQDIVSRENYPTQAQAEAAGAARLQGTARWAPPTSPDDAARHTADR